MLKFEKGLINCVVFLNDDGLPELRIGRVEYFGDRHIVQFYEGHESILMKRVVANTILYSADKRETSYAEGFDPFLDPDDNPEGVWSVNVFTGDVKHIDKPFTVKGSDDFVFVRVPSPKPKDSPSWDDLQPGLFYKLSFFNSDSGASYSAVGRFSDAVYKHFQGIDQAGRVQILEYLSPHIRLVSVEEL